LTLRLGVVGAGWIARLHLVALERLGRTELVGVASRTIEGAATLTHAWGGTPFEDLDRMLETGRPDAVYVCVPPHESVAIGERLVRHGIPFLTEKPLAADDSTGPARLAAAIQRAGLIVAVGYHLRALDFMPELRARLAERPPRMIVARWLCETPPTAWWSRSDQGGGQVVEQTTHLYDLARYLVGEAEVVGAASVPRKSTKAPAGAAAGEVAAVAEAAVAEAAVAVLRFGDGAIGSFASAHRLASASIEIAFASDGLLTTLRKIPDGGQGDWRVAFDDGREVLELRTERDPYEIQAAAFLDALDAGDPNLVLSSYVDALKTDRLTRAVVAATGAPG
jgi:myo-inositol 2-dehydrogenase/D-chiro-inositol 1-dehydrogenase